MPPHLIQGLGLALGLGLLVGFQRERAQAQLGGIRTFALITLMGAVFGHLSSAHAAPWMLGATAVALAFLLAVGHVARSRTGPSIPDLTSEVAALVMFGVGALAILGPAIAAVATGATVALLLHFKAPLHATVRKLADAEVRAVMTFVLIALVILPLLPDQARDPLGVLNPRRIWMMVVLIVGIGLVGHAAYRVLGPKAGAMLAGIVGGLISSTATTVDQARRTRATAGLGHVAAVVVIVASATTFVRIGVEIAIVAPGLLAIAAIPLLIVLLALAASVFVLMRRKSGEPVTLAGDENPAQLKTALVFGGLYAVVIVGIALSRRMFGDAGLTVVAILSGLTDVDAITLSTAQLVRDGQLEANVGWRVIMVGALSNLAFKGGLAVALGSRRHRILVAVAFVIAILVGIPIILYWPEGLRAWPQDWWLHPA